MITIQATVTKDTATPALKKLGKDLSKQRVLRVGGTTMRDSYLRHFASKRSKFWDSIAAAVSKLVITGSNAVARVSGEKGKILLHKIRGGTIKAKNSKYLTIPLFRNITNARRANVEVAFGRNQVPYGLRDVATKRVLFILKKQVYQKPDRNAIPVTTNVQQRINQAVSRQVQKAVR